MTGRLIAVDPALRSSGWALLRLLPSTCDVNGERTVTEVLDCGTVQVSGAYVGHRAELVLADQVFRLVQNLSIGYGDAAVLEQAQQPTWNEKTTARSRDVLGFSRGVWVASLVARRVACSLFASRAWQARYNLHTLKRVDRLKAIRWLAPKAARNVPSGAHLDACTAILIGDAFLREAAWEKRIAAATDRSE